MRKRMVWCLLAMLLPVGASAETGQKTLYNKAPWVVARVGTGSAATCIVKADAPKIAFWMSAPVHAATFDIGVRSPNWSFRKRVANVAFGFGENDFWIEAVSFSGNEIKGNLDMGIDSFLVVFVEGGSKTMTVKDNAGKALGSVPIKGMSTAIERWQACVAG